MNGLGILHGCTRRGKPAAGGWAGGGRRAAAPAHTATESAVHSHPTPRGSTHVCCGALLDGWAEGSTAVCSQSPRLLVLQPRHPVQGCSEVWQCESRRLGAAHEQRCTARPHRRPAWRLRTHPLPATAVPCPCEGLSMQAAEEEEILSSGSEATPPPPPPPPGQAQGGHPAALTAWRVTGSSARGHQAT